MKPVIGVIGAGFIAQMHLKAFEELKAQVKIVADPNAKSALAAAARFGAATADDWHAVLADPEVNVVTVFTPSGGHFEPVQAALQAGKHVICEKTLTLDSAQSLELGHLAERSNRILLTSYMKRFFPAVQKASQLMPRLGHIMSVYCRTYQGVGPDNFHSGALPAWVRPEAGGPSPIRRKSGGGVLVCGGSHVFDLLLFLVGKPEAVFARALRRPESDVDLMTHALFEFPGGGVGHFEANWHPLRKIGYESRGWDEGFEISGVNGRLVLQLPVWDHPENNAATLRYYDNAAETWTEFALPIVDPFVEAERFFLAQLAADAQGSQDRYTGYRVDLLLEKTQQSADEGRRIAIPWQV